MDLRFSKTSAKSNSMSLKQGFRGLWLPEAINCLFLNYQNLRFGAHLSNNMLKYKWGKGAVGKNSQQLWGCYILLSVKWHLMQGLMCYTTFCRVCCIPWGFKERNYSPIAPHKYTTEYFMMWRISSLNLCSNKK